MKFKQCIYLLVFIIIQASRCIALVESDDEVRVALKDWENSIRQSPTSYDPQTLSMLGEAVQKLSRVKTQYAEWRFKLFNEARDKALSIPGHAKYFADQVAAARKESKDIITDREYHRMCQTLSETLPHLPSPETVQVLGGMFESKADKPTLEQWIDFLKFRARAGIWSGITHRD